jgi:GNAT superfamily N-acetyltransferase
MDPEIIIRSMCNGEEEAVCQMIQRSFDRFVGCDYSREGVDEFYKYANPAVMASRLSEGHSILVADCHNQIVGMIEFRNNEHLSLLFVDPLHLRKGISRALFDHGLRVIRKANPSLERITVNSSRYAVPIYESFGFVASGDESTIKGITFLPMYLKIRAGGT